MRKDLRTKISKMPAKQHDENICRTCWRTQLIKKNTNMLANIFAEHVGEHIDENTADKNDEKICKHDCETYGEQVG